MGTVLKNNNNIADSNVCNIKKNHIIGKWWQMDKKRLKI